MYDDGSFTQNVAEAYTHCDESQISFLTAKHGIQTAFGRCGSNNFTHFEWSPDGVHLLFQLTHGAHILNGEKKTITVVPTETPIAEGAWVNANILALVLQPDVGKQRERIVLYNRVASTTTVIPLDVHDVRDMASWAKDSTEILLTARDQAGERHPYRLDTATGDLVRALPWLTQPIERLNVSQEAGLVAWSTADATEIAQLDDGATLHLLPGVLRAIPNNDGRWIALETLGVPISVFNQHTWGEGTDASRARDQARHEKWVERHLDGEDQMVQPPEIQLLDRTTGHRYRITAFNGDRLQWYPSPGQYVSFMMWGIEGKQMNRNVGLVSLAERIRMLNKGDLPMGIEKVQTDSSPSVEPSDQPPSAQPPSPTHPG
jgi:hypothetical protein